MFNRSMTVAAAALLLVGSYATTAHAGAGLGWTKAAVKRGRSHRFKRKAHLTNRSIALGKAKQLGREANEHSDHASSHKASKSEAEHRINLANNGSIQISTGTDRGLVEHHGTAYNVHKGKSNRARSKQSGQLVTASNEGLSAFGHGLKATANYVSVPFIAIGEGVTIGAKTAYNAVVNGYKQTHATIEVMSKAARHRNATAKSLADQGVKLTKITKDVTGAGE